MFATKETPIDPPQPFSRQPKQHDDIFVTKSWRDLWAAILYLAALATFITIAVINMRHLSKYFSISYSDSDKETITNLLFAQSTALLGSMVLSAAYLLLLFQFPEGMISACYIGMAGLFIGLGLWQLFAGFAVGGILTLFMGGLTIALYFWWRDFIPFSAVILKWTTKTIGEYPAVLLVNFGIMVALISSTVALFFSVAGVSAGLKDKSLTDAWAKGTTIYSIFWLLWTEEVLQGVSRVTSAGVFACRFFLGRFSPLAPNPTAESLKRATTYSFGSICFGSLLVSFITFLRVMLSLSDDRDSLAGMLVDCMLSIIEDLLRYFNTYAFTQVAIYGKNYIDAAKSTWELVKTSGVGGIVNDNLIGSTIFIGSLFISIASTAFCVLLVYLFESTADKEMFITNGVAAFLLSSLMAWCSLSIVSSGVTTFYVCLAEDPAALQRSDPDLYRTVSSKYSFLAL